MGKSFLSKHPTIKKMSKSLKSSFKSKKLKKVQKNGVYTFEEEAKKTTTTTPSAAAVVETTTPVDVLEKRTSEMSVSSTENETEVALVPEEDKMDEEESPIIEESPSAEVQSSFAAVLTEMMTCTEKKEEDAILPPAAEEEAPKEQEEESPDVEPSHTNEEPGVETVQQDDRVTIGFYSNDKSSADNEAAQEEQEPGVMANALALMEQYLTCGFSPGGTPIEPEVVVIDTQEVKKLSLPMEGETTEEESPEMEDGRDATEEIAAPAAELQAEIRA